MALPHPVIVVPGITATYLHDEYPLPPEDIWEVIKQDYERIVLHPDKRKNAWGRPAPGVDKSDWDPPLKLHFKG